MTIKPGDLLKLKADYWFYDVTNSWVYMNKNNLLILLELKSVASDIEESVKLILLHTNHGIRTRTLKIDEILQMFEIVS